MSNECTLLLPHKEYICMRTIDMPVCVCVCGCFPFIYWNHKILWFTSSNTMMKFIVIIKSRSQQKENLMQYCIVLVRKRSSEIGHTKWILGQQKPKNQKTTKVKKKLKTKFYFRQNSLVVLSVKYTEV